MTKHRTAVLLFILTLAGLFWSRALLSISQAAWAMFVLLTFRDWKTNYRLQRIGAWSLCVIPLFLTGWYQHPAEAGTYDFLLTLSMYPVAAFSVMAMEERTRRMLAQAWCWAALTGILYPVYSYIVNPAGAALAYGQGRSLPVFMDTDHVRFSIFLCGALLLVFAYNFGKSLYRNIYVAVLLVLIIFLSVRTGWAILLCLAIAALIVEARKSNGTRVVRAAAAAILLAVMSYFILPTVQKKVAYTIYDAQQFDAGKYDANFSDGARRSVNAVAYRAIKSGRGNAGWARVPGVLRSEAALVFPGQPFAYGWPFNQWLFWWLGGGIAGVLLFSIWLFFPAWQGLKAGNKWIIYWTLAITVSCLVESTLTLQFGVFLHAWPLALLWLRQDNPSENQR